MRLAFKRSRIVSQEESLRICFSIGGEAEMRGFMVECGERPLEGEGM